MGYRIFAGGEDSTRQLANWPVPDVPGLTAEDQLGEDGWGANEEGIRCGATKMPRTARALFPLA
jgi:hypothetical protein